MSRRRASTEAGVSLFPFLAVLVCLIGSLILLLILVSRQSKANAVAKAKQARAQATAAAAAAKPRTKRTAAPRAAPTPDPEAEARRKAQEREAAELEEALRQTEAAQADARRAAEESRAILSHLEDHIRQLQDDAQKLNVAESSLAKKLGDRGFTKQQLEKELASLRAAEKEKEDAIREAQEAAGKRKAFAIIPYEGPNGTRREPIYLECRGDRIILQPDGVVFPAGDFSGPVGPANPLAATVRAINEHRERKGVDGAARPYPLMLVRPDGVGAYYAARVALEGWDDEFGYELIDADLLLAFPPVDSERTALARRAAEDARYRQSQLAKIAPSLFNGGGGGMAKAGSAPRRFRVSPTGQGIIPDDAGAEEADAEPLFPKGMPSRIAAMKAAQSAPATGSAFAAGGSNGPDGRNGPGGMGFGTGDGTNGDGTGGYGARTGPGGGRPGFSNAGVASVRGGPGYGPGGTGSAFGGANGLGGPNGTGNGNGPGGPNAFGGAAPGQGTGGAFGGPDGSGNASAANAAGGQGGPGGGGSIGSGAPGGNGSPDGSGRPNGAPGQGTFYGDLAANGDPGGAGMTNNSVGGPAGQGGRASGQGSSPAGQGSGNGSGGGPGGGAASGGAQAGGGQQGGSTGGGSGASGGGQAGGGQQAGGASSGGGDPDQGGAGAPSFVFSDGRDANPPGGRSGQSSGGPPPQGGRPPSNYEPRYGEFVESIASRKGEGWAVGGPQGGSIAVRREVRVKLSRDLMKLAASGKEIPLDRGSLPAMEKLAKEIQTQIKGWGVAGRGMHWRPSLVFEVEPTAEERYLEIDQLLVGSGMEVRTVRPITSRTAVGRPPYEARNPAAVPPR